MPFASEQRDNRRMRVVLAIALASSIAGCRGGGGSTPITAESATPSVSASPPALPSPAPSPVAPSDWGLPTELTCNHDHLGDWDGLDLRSGTHPLRRERVRGKPTGVQATSKVVAAAMCDGFAPLRACYGKGRRGTKLLAGSVDLVLPIGADGRIASAKRMSGSLDDSILVECITKGLVGTRIDPSLAGLEVTYRLDLIPRIGVPSVARTTAKGTVDVHDATPWDIEQDNFYPWDCYERALYRNPELAGTLELSFVVDPGGKITDVKALATTTDKGLVDCVLQELPKAKFQVKTRTVAHETLTFSTDLTIE